MSKYSSGYSYSAFIFITKEQAEMFSKKRVTDVKLYIYEQGFKEKQAEKFRCATEAILKVQQ